MFIFLSQFFSNAGFPCPPLRNPSDHYLLSVNSDFDDVYNTFEDETSIEDDLEASSSVRGQRITAAEAVETLTQAFAASKEKQDVDSNIHVMSQLVSAHVS